MKCFWCIIQQSLASKAFLFDLNLVVKISFFLNLNLFENLIESFFFPHKLLENKGLVTECKHTLQHYRFQVEIHENNR